MTDTNPRVINVMSNGKNYTKLDYEGNFLIDARLEFDTGIAGRIKSWWIEPRMVNSFGPAQEVHGLNFYRESHSYPVGQRPKSINKKILFSVSSDMIEPNAVSMCNLRAAALRNQGKSDKWIFNHNHDVYF